MVDVSYSHELDYLRDSESGKPFPGLWVVVCGPVNDRELEVQAHLDSGTEKSFLDGQIGKAIGLDPGDGEVLYYRSSTGAELVARLHRVRLAHEELGAHELMVGFSERRITRNLLGRDFFDLFQIGFREHHSKILFSPEPR
jgi:hypothetical protein